MTFKDVPTTNPLHKFLSIGKRGDLLGVEMVIILFEYGEGDHLSVVNFGSNWQLREYARSAVGTFVKGSLQYLPIRPRLTEGWHLPTLGKNDKFVAEKFTSPQAPSP